MAQDADTGLKCIIYMLFTTNFMFSMIGFLLISVGTTIIAIYNDFEIFMEDHFFSPAALLIAIGVLIFLVSIFGCVGAARKSTCLINIFGLLLFCVLILEISAAIAGYVMRDDIYEYLEENMYDTVEDYGIAGEEETTNTWDFLQINLECCGVHGPKTWNNTLMPASCYYDQIVNPGHEIPDGCIDELNAIVWDCATLVGTGGLCVAVVQVLGVIFAFMLAKSIRRLKTEVAMQRAENQAFYAQLARGNAKQMPVQPEYTPQNNNY